MDFLKQVFSGKKPEDPEIQLLASPESDFEAELIMGILREHDIPCCAKNHKSGSLTRLITGISVSGMDIYIRRTDYSRAKELCAVISAGFEESNPPHTS